MKKIVIYSALVAGLAMTGCSDFLDVRPVGVADEAALLNKKGIEMSLVATYARLSNNSYFEAPVTNYTWGDVMGGDANKGSSFADQPDFTNIETYAFTIDNGYFNNKWRREYDGVFRSNNLIAMCDKIKDLLSTYPGDEKDFYTETVASARFLRAHHQFEVARLFGAAVPYVSTEAFVANVNPQVSNVDDSGNYIYIWDMIIDDLKFAYENLPNTRATSGNYGLANKWAAGALLAKVMMYQSSAYNGANGTKNRWAEVKSLLETIVANGVDAKGQKYRLASTYEELYTAGESDWTGESVFDIQTSISGTQTGTNAVNGGSHIAPPGSLNVGGWGFYQPSNDFVNAHIVDANGLPDATFRSKQPLTVAGVNANTPKTDLNTYTDPRLDYSVGRFQTPYLDWSIPTTIDGWVREVTNGGYYLNKKNIPKKADKGSLSVNTGGGGGSTAKNYHIIRFADVLLWYAEALIETGDLAGAREQINKVRARAANSYVKAADPATMEETTSAYVLDDKVNGTTKANAAGNYRVGLWPASQFASKDGALAALYIERRIELGMEGHHWYDLVRWNKAADELNKFAAYESKYLSRYSTAVWDKSWYYLPIPFNQINTMQGLLVQNDTWK